MPAVNQLLDPAATHGHKRELSSNKKAVGEDQRKYCDKLEDNSEAGVIHGNPSTPQGNVQHDIPASL